MKKGCQCVDCEHRDYCNKRNKGSVVYCDCYAKGQPMTEQEFIQSCDTEQLAETLWKIYRAGKIDFETHDAFEFFFDKEDAVEWLKQPHQKE